MDFGVTDCDIDRVLKVADVFSTKKNNSFKPQKKCKFCGKNMSVYNHGEGCFACLDRFEKEKDQKILDEIKRKSLEKEKKIFPKDIVTLVSNFFDLDEELIYKRCHTKDVNRARQIISLLLNKDLKFSLEKIGKILNGRTFSAISRSAKKAQKREKEEPAFSKDLEEIRTLI